MSLYLDPRTQVWYTRERVAGVRKATRLGAFPDRENAARAAEKLSIKWTPDPDIKAVVDRYIAEGIPDRHTTKSSYMSKLNLYIVPRWGADKLADIRPMLLNQWFRDLSVAPTTKAGIKTVFSQVWAFAMLNELVTAQQNPLALIRIKGSTKRLCKPLILNPEEIGRLIEQIILEPIKTMVVVAFCLGIRRGELIGLKWGDVNWVSGTILIQRSVVDNHVGDVKTEASEQ